MTSTSETLSPLSNAVAAISESAISETAVATSAVALAPNPIRHAHAKELGSAALDSVSLDSVSLDLGDFDAIFFRHHDMVYRVCLRRLRHHHDAEDVVQETFRRAAVSIQNWDRRRPIEPWLVTIAGNRCRSFLARRHREKATALFEVSPADYATSVVEEKADTEQKLISDEWLDTALNRLPADQRRAFELIHRDEFSYPQAAQEMGRSVGTIKTWVHRARNTMQDIFQRESVCRTVAASVASILLMAAWFVSRPSSTTSNGRLATVVAVDESAPRSPESRSAVESVIPTWKTRTTQWELASLHAFTEADLRFDRVESMPQGTIPVAHWIEQTTPVLEQFQQGVAPMRRTIRSVMMLFSCQCEPDVPAPASPGAELSEVSLSSLESLEIT